MKQIIYASLAAALVLLPAGCASLSYEAEEWRIVTDDDDAYAVVRYVGVSPVGRSAEAQLEAIERLQELAADSQPARPYTSMLQDAQRRVYIEGDRVVVEEAGRIRDPLSWFEQTGLNPLTWIEGSTRLSTKGDYVIKRGIADDRAILASNGRVVDEDMYERLTSRPVELASDKLWQTRDDQRIEELQPMDYLELIVWPRGTKTFYWKLSGPAPGAGRALAAELRATEPELPQVPLSASGAMPTFQTDEIEVETEQSELQPDGSPADSE
jgi:hypothetical protein